MFWPAYLVRRVYTHHMNKEREVKMTITEIQHKDITRTYNITGVKRETVESFWQYLVDHKVIKSFEIA